MYFMFKSVVIVYLCLVIIFISYFIELKFWKVFSEMCWLMYYWEVGIVFVVDYVVNN